MTEEIKRVAGTISDIQASNKSMLDIAYDLNKIGTSEANKLAQTISENVLRINSNCSQILGEMMQIINEQKESLNQFCKIIYNE